MPPLHQPLVRRTRAAALAAATVLALGACGGGSSGSSTPASGPSGTTAIPPMATVVSIDQVAGTDRSSYRRTFHTHAQRLTRDVGHAVDAWLDGAFVGVDYPTDSYPDAFTTFTAQAKQDALRQKDLMTTGALGARIDGVTTLKRTVHLDVLAPRGHAAGVTARVLLRFETSGQASRTVTVTGRLFLTQDAGAWRIFGFDVARGSR